MDIDFDKKLSEGMLGIGGAVDTYVMKNVKLTFRRDKRKKPRGKHAVLNERIMRIPSILGRDTPNKYTFVYDKKRETTYITDEGYFSKNRLGFSSLLVNLC